LRPGNGVDAFGKQRLAEVFRHFLSRRVALLGSAGERGMDDAAHGRDGGRAGESRRSDVQDGVAKLRERIAGESGLGGEHFKENGAEGEQIRASVHGAPVELLGRGVARRAEENAGDRCFAKRFGRFVGFGRIHILDDAEIEQLGAEGRKQDVGGLQIAVNDAELVEGLQGGEELERDLRGLAGGKRALLEALRQGFALDKLHDQDQIVGFLGDVIEAAGVRMGDLGGGAGFLPEALALRRIVGTGADEFQGYGAIEALVLGFENDTHAAFADLGQDAIRADGIWKRRQATRCNSTVSFRIPESRLGGQECCELRDSNEQP
jgi:hypothetical protein